MDTGEHNTVTKIDILTARFEDYMKQREQNDIRNKENFEDIWVELNKLRPMVWKMWAVATALPALISIGSYMIFQNG